MSWEEEYKKKLVTAEKAVSSIKSGDRVVFVQGMEPQALGLALASRLGDLEDVLLSVRTPGRDFGWYDPVFEMSFKIEVGFPLPIVRQIIAERRCDLAIGALGFIFHEEERGPADAVLLEVSPPDAHGYCSFGASVWTKKTECHNAKCVMAEVNKNLIRTYGENYIHVSEIDYFVEHTPSGKQPGGTDLLGRKNVEAGETEKTIAGYVETLVRDGDTLQVGVGSTSEWCCKLGTFEKKIDLGWHSETTPKGIIPLIRDGIITGKHKTINPGKAVATACGGGSKEDMDFINMNPCFELHSAEYCLDVRVIGQHDNMVCINSAVSVDFAGQIAAESIGPRVISGAGGQTSFAIGAFLSKGGRSITVMTSTAGSGDKKISRIAPLLAEGTIVTVPRTLSDYVITEYGIAHLKGKTQRQRALDLISIAHPDFRAELKKEAEKLYWP
ncbi:acetyl-CoA hydrolase/transferase family protein [Chloroflexota bacterium]